MKNIKDPAIYESWHHAPRGRWISDCEFSLLQHVLNASAGDSLLDVGCGTSHFSRRFAQLSLSVSGIDPDSKAIAFAREQDSKVAYLQGSALDLTFPDDASTLASPSPVIVLLRIRYWLCQRYGV